MKAETVIGGAKHPGTIMSVMASNAGYYIGFTDEDGCPYTRESSYFETFKEAEKVLVTFREV